MFQPHWQCRNFLCQRDGLTLRGEVYRPLDAAGPLPVIILSHGFTDTCLSLRRYAEHFAERGFAAYIFDFNGGASLNRSDGRSQDMTVFTEVADLKAVIAYALAQPDADADRLVLMGFSQGGFVSALTAAELGKTVARLILYYPALCIPDDARSGRMIAARFDPNDIPETMWCGDMLLGRDYAASVQAMDPMPAIAAYAGPVLIIHGDADPIVDVRYARQALAAYEAQTPGRCRLVVLPGAGHGFGPEDSARAMEEVEPFLQAL